jgi:microcystin-dependent protein
MDPFIGEIRAFGFGTFAPSGWLQCAGQTLNISEYQALGALISGIYGPNTGGTFTLPNLTSSVMVGSGLLTYPNNTIGNTYAIGSKGGQETVTLTYAQLPQHNHTFNVAYADNYQQTETNLPGAGVSLLSNILEKNPTTLKNVVGRTLIAAPANVSLAPQIISPAGTGGAHSNMQPYLAINYCIAYEGVWPSRQD